MKVIETQTKVELSTEESKTLDDARFILAEILDLLNDGDKSIFTDKVEWRYNEIDNAIILLDELAHDEVTIVEPQD